MNEHTILVAIDVEAPSRELAQEALTSWMPTPREGYTYLSDRGSAVLDSWWIATDDRIDGSDRDSAVFVRPGLQQDAGRLLEFAGMAEFIAGCGAGVNANDRSEEAQRTRDRISHWQPEVPDDTVIDLLMRVGEDVSRGESPDTEDVERLRAMFADDNEED